MFEVRCALTFLKLGARWNALVFLNLLSFPSRLVFKGENSKWTLNFGCRRKRLEERGTNPRHLWWEYVNNMLSAKWTREIPLFETDSVNHAKFKSVPTHFTSLIPRAVFQENNSRQSIYNLPFDVCKHIAFEVQLSLKVGQGNRLSTDPFFTIPPSKTVASL
jgi:hypothetical protein